MKKYGVLISALLTVALLGACSAESSSDPTAGATSSPTQTSAPPTPRSLGDTGEFTTGRITDARIDESALETIPAVEGFSSTDVNDAVIAARNFALAGVTDPDFYTGAWFEQTGEEIAAKFADSATVSLQGVITGLDRNDPEDARAIASIAPVLRPAEQVSLYKGCEETWRQCVLGEIVFSDLAASVTPEDPRLKITFTVTATRAFKYDGRHATSPITYQYQLWMNQEDEEWKVDAFYNNYTFGAAVIEKEPGEG